MGDSTPFPSSAAIKRAEQLTRERFVFEGETAAEALAPGTARRRALDAALVDVAAGLKVPSLEWRQEYSLLLGLERLLSEEEPKLVDGTVLSAHQVDALSGTLTALLAGVQTVEAAAIDAVAEVEDEIARDEEIEEEIEAELDADDARMRPTTMRQTAKRTKRKTAKSRRPSPTRRRSRRTGSTTTPPSTRTSQRSNCSPTTRAPRGASGSSTPPARVRPLRLSASSRRRAPAAC